MNLTEVVVRANDTLSDLKRKARLATILGTIQATFTHFPYLRDVWKKNTEEEALLGVSLTGIKDHKLLSGSGWSEWRHWEEFVSEEALDFGAYGLEEALETLRDTVLVVNEDWSGRLGIKQATATTCVKPSGTVSQLVNSASGIHERHSEYYIRTVRGDVKDPLTQFMIAQGIPNEPEINKPKDTVVFSFPIKSPEGAVVRNEVSALEQLKLWLTYQRSWCEHKPSVTISVKEHEWMEVGAWVYKHFDEVSGISFLPYDGGTYQQAPYQEVTKEVYEAALAKMPSAIDWSLLPMFEKEDTTVSSQTFACSGGVCELVDVGA